MTRPRRTGSLTTTAARAARRCSGGPGRRCRARSTSVGCAPAVPEQPVEVGDVHERMSARSASGCRVSGDVAAGRVVLQVDRRQVAPGPAAAASARRARARAAAAAPPGRPSLVAAAPGGTSTRRAGQSQVRARPSPSGPRSGVTGRGMCGPWTNAVVHEPCTCQSRMLMRHRRVGRAQRAHGVEHVAPGRPTLRQGWPGTGQRGPGCPGTRPAGRRAGRAARRTGAQRAAGTTGANSETTGVPTAAARCAGPVLPTTTRAAPASTPASWRSVGGPAEVDARARPPRRGERRRSPRPPVTTTRCPRRQRGGGPPRTLGAARRGPARGAPGAARRTARARSERRCPAAARTRRAVVAGGQREAGAPRRQASAALRASWRSPGEPAVAQVEQGARVVLAVGGDPAAPRPAAAAARSAAGTGGTRSAPAPGRSAGPRIRAIRVHRRPARPAARSRSTQGSRRTITSSHTGQQAAGRAPAGRTAASPSASGGHRADRGTGQQHVAGAVEPDRREAARRAHRSPRRAAWSDRRPAGRRTTGGGGDLLGRVDRGRHQHPVGARRHGRPRCRRRCPRSRRPRGGHAEGRGGASTNPGAGLRHRHPSSGPCGQTSQMSNGPSSSSTRPLPRPTCSGPSSPRAIPDWLVTTPTGTPPAQQGGAGSAVGTGRPGPGRRCRARRPPACRPGRRARHRKEAGARPE